MMGDAPTGSVHRKRDVFRRLKNSITKPSKDSDTSLVTPRPNTSEPTTKVDAKSDPVHPRNDISKSDDHDAKNFWQMAYDKLTESDQDTLATLLPATAAKPQDVGRPRTEEILNQVVKTTEAQYREKGRKDGIRATAYRILNSALSFQDVVNNAVKFDPTGYASSAWAIVSLGLTVCFFHQGSRAVC